MIRRSLKRVHEMAGGLNVLENFQDAEICGVSIDSRNIEKNNLFIPLNGENVNGHQYVEGAIKNGAAASLWEKGVPNPPVGLPLIIVEDALAALQQLAKEYRSELSLKVVGVTGSNGKTTTKDMTASLLQTRYKVHKTSGNFNNHIGLPLTILSMGEDTEAAVLEMGMSARGEIKLLSEIGRPDVAVITNIGESHLLDLGSREEIANAKLEILSGLSEDGVLIYHGDEPLLSDRIKAEFPKVRVLSFGRSENNDMFPISITQEKDSTSFTLNSHPDAVMTIPVLGNHNVLNAMASMLAAKEAGVPEASMQSGMDEIRLTNMRMEMVEGARGEKIINDAYNASPTSMKAAIELMEGMSGFRKKILVLGDMLELGEQEGDYHRKIGEQISAEKIDQVFTFGPLAEKISEGALTVFSKENVFAFQDKSELIEELKKHTDTNDLILVKASRGMKLEQVVSALQ
ncbi:UDP-N-acetylmuramoyl-tripeptide--D-alanyl-D-alanine ligase [Bacillus sp. MUM 13]|uniref:UDP-N-acetylmuramoyl-tripeptide--D-alanyl-D- alanine ligase n=1 Tax=Bacillus sp. MUM 13 TaxID=1678001 RepID=UPI0008F58292|nr:UDP-N-acetylmuramoyl-tripeptide--D-alanyl-D-alanine ligase [Bacillus sp. MUM 13]OIK10891.1 UDP-N-acetylmuramoyl-tripeptide--D-alanyl-D-alanine ligase [Bacillus sp. MUM 13]